MIQETYFLTIVGLLTVGTVCIRGSFIAISGKMNISTNVRTLFTYIPAAIFPALVVPVTFFHQGQVDWINGKERFVILLAASLLCYFVRSTLLIIGFGLVSLYLLTQLS